MWGDPDGHEGELIAGGALDRPPGPVSASLANHLHYRGSLGLLRVQEWAKGRTVSLAELFHLGGGVSLCLCLPFGGSGDSCLPGKGGS